MKIRTYISLSLDGFMASSDGAPAMDVMPSFEPGVSHGIQDFLADCSAVIVGRTVFDFGYNYWRESGMWAWQDKRVYVLTSQPLPDSLPPDTFASRGGPVALRAQIEADNLPGDVHLVGGLSSIRAFFEIGAIDEFGVLILPVLLHEGTPLFPLGAQRQWLKLESSQTFPDGSCHLIYKLVNSLAS